MNFKHKKLMAIIAVIACTALMFSACKAGTQTENTDSDTDTATVATATVKEVSDEALSELFTNRDLDPSYDENEAIKITLADNATAADSQNVTVDGNVITITDEGVYLISGSLSDGQIIVEAEDSDKIQLVLDGVTLNSTATAAIYVKEADKVFITTAENSDNTLTETGEFVADGDTNVDAVIFSKSDLTLCGQGTLTVSTAYGNGITSKDDLKLTLGTYQVDVSGKGLEANDSIRIADGTYTVTSEDDSIHSNGYTTIVGGSFTLSSGDDGIHSDGETTISGGTVDITESYEGIEGQAVTITGGTISLKASDDGLNAAGGNDQSGYGSMMDEFAADENAMITISGGTLYINAEGDGIDSNGNLEISGGTITVDGPTNGGNGALDYNGTATITGGTIVAVGASSMAENFTEATQGAIMVNFTQSFNGGDVTVTDSNGNVLFTFTASKSFNSVVVSSPDLKKGETYTVSVGDEYQTVTLDDYIYGSGSGMGMGGMQGGPGGMQGGPGGMQGRP